MIEHALDIIIEVHRWCNRSLENETSNSLRSGRLYVFGQADGRRIHEQYNIEKREVSEVSARILSEYALSPIESLRGKVREFWWNHYVPTGSESANAKARREVAYRMTKSPRLATFFADNKLMP